VGFELAVFLFPVAESSSPSACEPAPESESRALDARTGGIVVEPAESLDLLEDVEMFEVVDEFLDEEAVDGSVKGIARELVFEIVEDQGDTRIWDGLGLSGSWVSSVVG